MGHLFNWQRIAKPGRNRSVKPVLEGLEDRMLLYATTGDHFTYGSRITWSIVPDGTSLGGSSSNLIATLDADIGPVNSWLGVFQDAFAEWENVANVNFVQVQDSGGATGSGTIQQDSPAFGDIRIGGYVQSNGVLAYTLLPPAANGGSESGDIFMNTGQAWHVGTNYDLETVLVHEIGHALGMGHSADSTAVMYAYYGGVEDSPNTDDIAGVQSIWGARQYDPFVTNFNNLTMANAASINGWLNTSNYQVYIPGLNLINPGETEWFSVTTPANSSNVFTAQVQSSNLSELSPRVVIFNSAGVGLTQTSAPATTYGATINATISNATQATTYYIKVLGSNSGDSGDGAYALTINMGFQTTGTATPPNTLVNSQASQGGGSTQEQIGGANTKANTPVDVPDKITDGSFHALGDYLMAPSKNSKFTKHPVPQVAVSHPIHRSSAKHEKASSKKAHTSKK